jgi:hypothetical protein
MLILKLSQILAKTSYTPDPHIPRAAPGAAGAHPLSIIVGELFQFPPYLLLEPERLSFAASLLHQALQGRYPQIPGLQMFIAGTQSRRPSKRSSPAFEPHGSVNPIRAV